MASTADYASHLPPYVPLAGTGYTRSKHSSNRNSSISSNHHNSSRKHGSSNVAKTCLGSRDYSILFYGRQILADHRPRGVLRPDPVCMLSSAPMLSWTPPTTGRPASRGAAHMRPHMLPGIGRTDGNPKQSKGGNILRFTHGSL